MKRIVRVTFCLMSLLWLVGCQEKGTDLPSETNPETLTLFINGVYVEGEHVWDGQENIKIDTQQEAWLQTLFPDKKSVHTSTIRKDYQVVKEEKEEKANTYRMVVLPKTFEYASPEENGTQTWVNASLYPKGWYVIVQETRLDKMMTEVIPKEDYKMRTDNDGFQMGVWNDEVLGGWPVPSVARIEIIDFPNGHADMEEEAHYSLEFFFH